MKAFEVVVCFRLKTFFHYIIYLASLFTKKHSAYAKARAAVQVCGRYAVLIKWVVLSDAFSTTDSFSNQT